MNSNNITLLLPHQHCMIEKVYRKHLTKRPNGSFCSGKISTNAFKARGRHWPITTYHEHGFKEQLQDRAIIQHFPSHRIPCCFPNYTYLQVDRQYFIHDKPSDLQGKTQPKPCTPIQKGSRDPGAVCDCVSQGPWSLTTHFYLPPKIKADL